MKKIENTNMIFKVCVSFIMVISIFFSNNIVYAREDQGTNTPGEVITSEDFMSSIISQGKDWTSSAVDLGRTR